MEEGYDKNLHDWYNVGLTTICLSAVHYLKERNEEIYGKDYCDIKELVSKLHKMGFTVRLSVMLLKGFIDSVEKFQGLAQFCHTDKIAQLTIRPIDGPSKGCKQFDFVDKHTLYDEWDDIKSYVDRKATLILNLAHGAKVYDLYGQNVCLGTCMTKDDTEDSMRQLIFFPNGELRYNWTYNASVLLKGRDS